MSPKRKEIIYPEGMIQLMRCTQGRQIFAVRFDLIGEMRWSAAWSFRIKEYQAKEFSRRLNSSQSIFVGKLKAGDPNYRGCAYCDAMNFVQCAKCGKLACRDQQKKIICPWCQEEIGEIQQKIKESVGQSDL